MGFCFVSLFPPFFRFFSFLFFSFFFFFFFFLGGAYSFGFFWGAMAPVGPPWIRRCKYTGTCTCTDGYKYMSTCTCTDEYKYTGTCICICILFFGIQQHYTDKQLTRITNNNNFRYGNTKYQTTHEGLPKRNSVSVEGFSKLNGIHVNNKYNILIIIKS